MIQRPRGTRDFLPGEAYRRSVIRGRMAEVMETWGYQEVSTPTFEHLELFTAKSGEGILEEIYNFKDKGGRDLALRPELTAPVIRMYVNELQNSPKPLRLYYFGNCFRYERPQKGRFREFWQMGCELIGGRKTDSEAEVIALAASVLERLGVRAQIHVGYLGLIRSMMERIPPDHRREIMRMIDKKEPGLDGRLKEIGCDSLGLQELLSLRGRAALDQADEIATSLAETTSQIEGISMGKEAHPESPGSGDRVHASPLEEGERFAASGQREGRHGRQVQGELGLASFRELVNLLEAYEVEHIVDFRIVRGLEYYTGTVFEVYAQGLGAQSQICGGGTYELAGLLGGAETSSTGFGLGFDRIMEVLGQLPAPPAPAVLAFTPDVRQEAIQLARRLREAAPLVVDVMGRSLGAQLKAASSLGAPMVVILGRSELDQGMLTLRDMRSGQQESMNLEAVLDRLARVYSRIDPSLKSA